MSITHNLWIRVATVLAVSVVVHVSSAAAIAVSNVTMVQRADASGIVDITYDLDGGALPMTVVTEISSDNGATWDVIPDMMYLSGDVGALVPSGAGKHIAWTAKADRPGVCWSQARARVSTTDYVAAEDEVVIVLPGGVPLVLVHIPAGSFAMGCYSGEQGAYSDESPQHTVTIGHDFYLGKYEVTQEQWRALMGVWPGEPTDPSGGVGDAYPLYWVSWDEARSFMTALNEYIATTAQGAVTVRLPSESEWEYACRAGTTTRFYFGDSLGCTSESCADCAAGVLPGNRSDYMWYCSNNSPAGTKPVGGKLPNAFGLYDIAGNVWEWVEDDYHSSYVNAPVDGSAWTDSPRATDRICRGCGWYGYARRCRSAARYASGPASRGDNLGFRVAALVEDKGIQKRSEKGDWAYSGISNAVALDTAEPLVVLLGDPAVTVHCGGAYSDSGATAVDDCTGVNLTTAIVTDNPVNTDIPGEYTIRYNVSDVFGNEAGEMTRSVTVLDDCPEFCTDNCGIGGMVTNSLTGAPLEGVYVEISAAVEKSLAVAYTDSAGHYLFESLSNGSGPYDLSFTLTEYAPQYFTRIRAENLNFDVALAPRGVTRPKTVTVLSAPRAMYVDWPANPEYNVKGYNVWRTETDISGMPQGAAVKLNGDPGNVYDGILAGLEYVDGTVQKGAYYIYQVQAISGADRPSALSYASYPPAKGQWVTVFFPEIAVNNAGFFLWENPGHPSWVTLPLCSRCTYDVSTSGLNIRAYLPSALVNATQRDDIQVSLTGITSGMTFDYNLLPVDGDPDRLELLIASSDTTGHPLYGAGTLFNVSVLPKAYDGCGPLELVEDQPGVQDGVRLYDDGDPAAMIDIELENGALCGDSACTHGDVNMDGSVTAADVDCLLAIVVKLLDNNACSAQAGDINLDGRVDSADAVMLLRWLKGMDITPPDTKSNTPAQDSFAAAAPPDKAGEQPLVTIQNVYGQVGTPVDLPVTLQHAAPLAGCQMRITFPEGTAGVVFTSLTVGETFSGWHVQSKHTSEGDKGYLDIAMNNDSASNVTEETTLLTMRFTLFGNISRTIPIRMSSFNITDQYGFEPRFDAPSAPVATSGAIIVGNGAEGEDEGEGVSDIHSADINSDRKISLQELLRVIQFFNMSGYACDTSGASTDGYAPGFGAEHDCKRHASDYDTTAWQISLQELLRLIQFFNMGKYHACPDSGTADGYCPG